MGDDPRAAAATRVVGVDGYRDGWVAAHVGPDGAVRWSVAPVGGFADLVAPSAAGPSRGPVAIGVDIPVGAPDSGWRACDLEAKEALGRAASRVFLTPPRPVLALGPTADNARAQALSRRLTGQGVSRQALALADRIRDVDAALRAHPVLARVLVEVHPELSFAAMTGGPPLPSKRTAVGVAQRLDALAPWVDAIAALRRCPDRVPVDDALDALAAAWSAARWGAGTARTLPGGPVPRDGTGLPMRIVV